MICLPSRATWIISALTAVTIVACAEQLPTDAPGFAVAAARQAASGSPVVSSTVPSSGARGTTLDVRILGSGFDFGSTAQWAIDGIPSGNVVVNRTTYVSSKELRANISIASDADLTFYDVIVTSSKGGKPGIGTETFEVTVQITDLGNLGGTASEALAINENGQVAGVSNGIAFLWENGAMRSLGIPAGFTSSRGEGINNLGHVVGYAMREVSGVWNSRAFLWTPELGLQLLGGSEHSVAYAINDNGMVAGYARMPDGASRAAVWVNGAIQFLPPGASVAYDVNNRGEVVGDGSSAVLIDGMRWSSAFIWSEVEGLRPVATLRGSAGEGLGINDAGQVVGWGPHATNDSLHHAYVSQAGVAKNMGEDGVSSSVIYKIASNGLMVGRNKPYSAALWFADGSMILLPAFNGSNSPEVFDVNSSGQAVGRVRVSGKRSFTQHAVMWSMF
jgi:uncharacterized membrane protein